jgi:hypothetical protein
LGSLSEGGVASAGGERDSRAPDRAFVDRIPVARLPLGGGYSVFGAPLMDVVEWIQREGVTDARGRAILDEYRRNGHFALLTRDGGLMKGMQQRVELHSEIQDEPVGHLFVTRWGDANVAEVHPPDAACQYYVQQYHNGASTLIPFSDVVTTGPGVKERLGPTLVTLIQAIRARGPKCGLEFDGTGSLTVRD